MTIKRSGGGGLASPIERRRLTFCDGRPVAHLLVHGSGGDVELDIADLAAVDDALEELIAARTELAVAIDANYIEGQVPGA
ncbi:hypothetical protein AB0C10_21550 [Microbispora amethystogenes]|uniref:hypothetical protein n=1 Tax=Microbispora amethystogenes TaxID=1427754 RepID=UPI0033F7F942